MGPLVPTLCIVRTYDHSDRNGTGAFSKSNNKPGCSSMMEREKGREWGIEADDSHLIRALGEATQQATQASRERHNKSKSLLPRWSQKLDFDKPVYLEKSVHPHVTWGSHCQIYPKSCWQGSLVCVEVSKGHRSLFSG